MANKGFIQPKISTGWKVRAAGTCCNNPLHNFLCLYNYLIHNNQTQQIKINAKVDFSSFLLQTCPHTHIHTKSVGKEISLSSLPC